MNQDFLFLGCLVIFVFANFDTLRFFQYSVFKVQCMMEWFAVWKACFPKQCNISSYSVPARDRETLVSRCIVHSQWLVSVLFKNFKSHDVPDTVGLSGLEPPTSRLSGVRSNRLSYKPI